MPHHFSNAYRPVPPDAGSRILYYEGCTCLMKRTDGEIHFPTFQELKTDGVYSRAGVESRMPCGCTYLFSVDEERYYLLEESYREGLLGLKEYQMEEVRIFRSADPQYRAFAGITGHQLYQWYHRHRFCSQCGSKTIQDKKERMLYCESCGNMEYPRINPAVIIAVTDKNRVLLSKYAGGTYKKYALLAGYTEIGETVEETVAREVMEEVGLRVKNIRYYKSQPWAFSGTLLMGFYCDLDGADSITLDQEELSMAEWFEREEIPVEPSRDSLTNEMIMAFKEGRFPSSPD